MNRRLGRYSTDRSILICLANARQVYENDLIEMSTMSIIRLPTGSRSIFSSSGCGIAMPGHCLGSLALLSHCCIGIAVDARPFSAPMADSGTSAYNLNPGGKNQYPPCRVTSVLLCLLNTITIYGCTITAGVNDLTLLQRYH